jgi:translation initiation factor eIF-2B subunit beta
MVLRIIKFLKEEYQTALSSAMTAQFPPGTGDDILAALSGNPQTPFSLAQTPYPMIPQDTSATFNTGHQPRLTRQDTHFPFDASRAPSRSDSIEESPAVTPGEDGVGLGTSSQSRQPHASTIQIAMQPIATSSIFELLGHDPQSNHSHAASMSSSFYSSATGHSTPVASEVQSPVQPGSPVADSNSNSTTNLFRSQSKSQLFAVHRDSLARFQTPSMTSLAPMLKRVMSQFEDEFSKKANDLKPLFTDAIGELADELGMVRDQVAAQAVEHIHSA